MHAEVDPLRILPGDGVEILDQTLLPGEERRLLLRDLPAMCEAIRELRIRGAPLLGIAGACAMAIAAETQGTDDSSLIAAAGTIAGVRPTAIEPSALARRALDIALAAGGDPAARREALWRFAEGVARQRRDDDRSLAKRGASLLPEGAAVLTHCNTGALATGGIGTALGVIRVAREEGRLSRCFATETRPLLQGARLTMWELERLGIPATLLPDTAAASLIAGGHVQAVIAGADRIAANGDTANKVGTYGLAAVAARHGVPFYIAAPTTTFDLDCPDGSGIPIEFRSPGEVGGFGGMRWSPPGSDAYNPAFDVTPASLITAIVTESGVATAPYISTLKELAPAR